jgi:hypothetical protein
MASPNDTIITLAMGGTLVDSSGNQWTITSGGQAAENGVTDTGTNQVVEMAYVNGLVWQESAAGLEFEHPTKPIIIERRDRIPVGAKAAPPMPQCLRIVQTENFDIGYL